MIRCLLHIPIFVKFMVVRYIWLALVQVKVSNFVNYWALGGIGWVDKN